MDKQRQRARQLRNASTDAERKLWQSLRGSQLEGFRFRRQVPIGGYIEDFVCPQAKLIVEVDGGQHAEHVQYDTSRTKAMETLGYSVLRYWNHDVLLRTEDVVADIYRILTKSFTPPQPSPSLREREGVEATAVREGVEATAVAGTRRKAEAEAEAEAVVAAAARQLESGASACATSTAAPAAASLSPSLSHSEGKGWGGVPLIADGTFP